MSINSVNGSSSVDTSMAYKPATATKKETVDKEQTAGVVYEKGTNSKPATYSINKMDEKQRSALVDKMKQDQADRQSQFMNMVSDMFSKQAQTGLFAGGEDSVWKFLAEGKFTVTEAAKAQAQQDISEDGYYGVKQTSQRLFDFASALAGDDVDKMKDMQKAMEKGFKEATKSWGRELPQISHDTLQAANDMFDDYYNSKI